MILYYGTKIASLAPGKNVVSPNGRFFFPHGKKFQRIFCLLVSMISANRQIKGMCCSPNGSTVLKGITAPYFLQYNLVTLK